MLLPFHLGSTVLGAVGLVSYRPGESLLECGHGSSLWRVGSKYQSAKPLRNVGRAGDEAFCASASVREATDECYNSFFYSPQWYHLLFLQSA